LFLVFQIIDKINIHKISKKSINIFERVDVYNIHPFDEKRFDSKIPAVSDVQSVFMEETTQEPAAIGYPFNNRYPIKGNIKSSIEDIIKIIENKIPIIIGFTPNNSDDTITEDKEVPVEPDAITADSSLLNFNFFDIKYEIAHAENIYINENKNILSIRFKAKLKFFTISIPNDIPNNIIPIFIYQKEFEAACNDFGIFLVKFDINNPRINENIYPISPVNPKDHLIPSSFQRSGVADI
jgi:hypothetical protein